MLPFWLLLGALDGAALVVIGAAGSHGVIEDPARVRLFGLAADYHAWHALALVTIGFAGGRATGGARRLLHATAMAFFVGTILFSGSLYVHALTGGVAVPMVTPLGGGILILGWIFLAAAGTSLMRKSAP
jgi:uncharacterized membrane protein YgdD (TMEM256/DUF423 family)